MIPQWEQDIINSKIRKHIYVIEWLDNNENVLDEVTIDVISGSMNFDATKSSRRSCNLILKNLDKEYIPAPNGKVWFNRKLRIKAGYEYGNEQRLLYNQGVFILGDPSLYSSPAQKEATIEGLDKWALFDGTISGDLKSKIIIPVGTRVDTAVKKLVTEVGGESKYIIDSCDVLLPYTLEKEKDGATIASMLEEIGNIVSYSTFFDNNGYFRFRKALKPADYAITPVDWYYCEAGLYLESNRNLKLKNVRNSIEVIGATLDNGVVISAVSKDVSDSEFSVGKIGERFKSISDDNIFTTALAQDRADWELQQSIMVAEETQATIIPNFSHVVENIINATDAGNGTNGNYLLQTMSYDLAFDAQMTLGLWAIRDWRLSTQ